MKSISGWPFIAVFSALVLIVSGFTASKTKNTDRRDSSAVVMDRSENEETETQDTDAVIDTAIETATTPSVVEVAASPQPRTSTEPEAVSAIPEIVVAGAAEQVTPDNNWIVPEGYLNKINPIESNSISLKAGRSLYNRHCASCHGREGLGDGTKANNLDTSAGDFSLPSFQDQTDGVLFYKTWIGRNEMPQYNSKLPDQEDIWDIINYMRTFSE